MNANINMKASQILLVQNKSCHEDSRCTTVTTGTEIRNAMWCKLEDLPKRTSVGLPLYYDCRLGTTLLSDRMGHQLLIGSTGTGKTQGPICDSIDVFSRMGDSVKPSLFITDPKGELIRKTGADLKNRGYKLIVIDTRHPESSSRYNPISRIYDDYQETLKIRKNLELHPKTGAKRRQQMLLKIAKLLERVDRGINELSNIMIPINTFKEPNWPIGARNLLQGLIWTALYDSENPDVTQMTRERFTLENIARIAFSTEDDCDDLVNYLRRAAGRSVSVKKALTVLDIRAKQTRDSYLVTLNTSLGEYTSYSISALTATSNDIDIDKIVRSSEPYAIFLITDDRNPTTNNICMMFLNNLLTFLMDYADELPDQALPRDFVFQLDEFANMPEMPKLTDKITTLRSRKIWLLMAIQSVPQLAKVYGEESSETIQDNCDFTMYLGSNNQKTKEIFADSFGKKTGIRRSFSVANDGSLSGAMHTEDVPVVRRSDLENLPFGEFFIRSRLCGNMRSYMTPYYMREDKGEKYDHKETFHLYDSEQYQYDIAEMMSREEEEQRKKSQEESDVFDRFNNADGTDEEDDHRGVGNSFLDALLRARRKADADANANPFTPGRRELDFDEEYTEVIINEFRMASWRSGLKKSGEIRQKLAKIVPAQAAFNLPVECSDDDRIELSYFDEGMKLFGFENELVSMIIGDERKLDKEACRKALIDDGKTAKRLGLSAMFCEKYTKAADILKNMSDEDFTKRRGEGD